MANILVVDDEPDFLEQMPAILSRWGHRAFTAADGFQALEIFERESIDLILSDVRMPNMDGIQLLHKIQDIDKRCPLILLTGYPADETAIQAMHSGAEDYLVKPINYDELRVRIEKSLQRKAHMNSIPFLRGLNWALAISIPFWLIIGYLLARLLR